MPEFNWLKSNRLTFSISKLLYDFDTVSVRCRTGLNYLKSTLSFKNALVYKVIFLFIKRVPESVYSLLGLLAGFERMALMIWKPMVKAERIMKIMPGKNKPGDMEICWCMESRITDPAR